MEALSNIILAFGVVFMLFGVVGVFRFKDFYTKLIVAAKIETVGVITFLFGLMIRHGLSFFSAKLLLIMGIILVLNPLVTHIITRAAYLSEQSKQEGKTHD